MAASESDFQEHLEAGFRPQSVFERYYFHTHPDQPFNRVVDIGPHIEKKIDAIVECQSQGGGARGAELRARLAREGKRLPLLGNDDRTANREYVRQFLLDEDRDYGTAAQSAIRRAVLLCGSPPAGENQGGRIRSKERRGNLKREARP